jgi:hypothetical protein
MTACNECKILSILALHFEQNMRLTVVILEIQVTIHTISPLPSITISLIVMCFYGADPDNASFPQSIPYEENTRAKTNN